MQQNRVRLDAKSSAILLNRYLAFVNWEKYDDSGALGEEKVIENKSYYSIQWKNISNDLIGIFRTPRLIPTVSYSLAAFWFIITKDWDLARYTAFVIGAVSFDATSNSGASSLTTSFSWSHTCTGTNRTLVVALGRRNPITASTATYNGVSMSVAGNYEPAGVVAKCTQWYLAAPATGSNTVALSWTGGTDAIGGAVSFTGSDGTVGSQAQASGTGSTSASISVSSASGDMCVDCLSVAVNDSLSITGGQTSRWNTNATNSAYGGSTEAAVGASTGMSWSWTNSDHYAIVGIAVKQGTQATLFTQTISESVVLVDARSVSTGKLLSEALSLVDTIKRSLSRAFSETLTLVDSVPKTLSRALSETITLVDTFTSRYIFSKVFSETITLADSLFKKTKRTFSEAVTLVDTVPKTVSRAFSEAIALADTLVRKSQKLLSEVVSLADTLTKAITRTLSETLTLVDTLIRLRQIILTETLTLADSLVRKTKKLLAETISLALQFLRWLTKAQNTSSYTNRTKHSSTFTYRKKS